MSKCPCEVCWFKHASWLRKMEWRVRNLKWCPPATGEAVPLLRGGAK